MKAEKERLEHQVTVQQQLSAQLRNREEKNGREIAAIAEKLQGLQLLFGAEIEGVKKEVRQEVKQSEKRLREEFSLKPVATTAHRLIDSKDWYWGGNGCSSSSSLSPNPEQSPPFKPMEDASASASPRVVAPPPCSLFDWPTPQPPLPAQLAAHACSVGTSTANLPAATGHASGRASGGCGNRGGGGGGGGGANASSLRVNKTCEDFDEAELIGLVEGILAQHVSLPIGKMGSMLHRAANNHTLPAKIKVRYGGLKRFLQAHSDKFCLGTDHPYNPHVRLAGPSHTTSTPVTSTTERSMPPPAQACVHAHGGAHGGALQGCGAGKRRLGQNSSKKDEGIFLALECEFFPSPSSPHPSPFSSFSSSSSPCPSSSLTRCCVITFTGVVLYDKHVEGTGPPGSPQRPLATLQREVASLLQGNYIVGHSLQRKLRALNVRHDRALWRDVSLYHGLCPCGPKTLPDLLWERLGVFFQTRPNQCVEEARACLAVYKSVLREWEASIAKQPCNPPAQCHPHPSLPHASHPHPLPPCTNGHGHTLPPTHSPHANGLVPLTHSTQPRG